MQQLGFHSVFAKLFASVMLALILFAVAMVLLTQLVHDKDANIRSEILATQILGQIDPFLQELNITISEQSRLQSRFMLAVVKKSFDIFDESLQAKMGLYDNQGHLLMQTDNSDLPLQLPATPSLLSRVFPSFVDTPPTQQAQVYSSTGYTLLYESRLPPRKPVLSAALNLFTGTLLLLIIMANVLWWIARSMTWRINQLSQQMTQLGDGDFTVRVNAGGNDEIASLARGFNQAAQKIEHLINANNLLLAHASHELRTPITRIRLQIEMMDMLANVMPSDTKAKFDKRAQAINRDLSGLNDLVESILLVSRLDAGHVMQQVERLDIYDLVNQERQHYSEATLIGEHIVIEGQPPMLTHLIRNLLNNAMLHGEPPVTVLIYGVQSFEEADCVPDYLLQSVLCRSFAECHIEYNAEYSTEYDAEDDDLDKPNGEQKAIADNNSKPINDSTDNSSQKNSSKAADLLTAPVIYRNGESLIIDIDDSNNDGNNNSNVDSDNGAESNNNDNLITKTAADSSALVAEQTLSETKVLVTTSTVAANLEDLDSLNDLEHSTKSNSSLLNNYNKFTADLADKVKKVIWRAVPNPSKPLPNNKAIVEPVNAVATTNLTNNNDLQNLADAATINNAINKNDLINNSNNQGSSDADNSDNDNAGNGNNNADNRLDNRLDNHLDNNNDLSAAPRKEGLFKKHLKKSKAEPSRPLPKYVVLAVIDEGEGIPEAKRTEIFSPFVRLQQKNKGSGLGLSLVAQIVTAHQGRITTDTINGHTRFLVVLPVKHDPNHRYQDQQVT
jgi:signal transduction histidine kinase